MYSAEIGESEGSLGFVHTCLPVKSEIFLLAEGEQLPVDAE
jgi:hypothetical protein